MQSINEIKTLLDALEEQRDEITDQIEDLEDALSGIRFKYNGKWMNGDEIFARYSTVRGLVAHAEMMIHDLSAFADDEIFYAGGYPRTGVLAAALRIRKNDDCTEIAEEWKKRYFPSITPPEHIPNITSFAQLAGYWSKSVALELMPKTVGKILEPALEQWRVEFAVLEELLDTVPPDRSRPKM